MDEITGHWYCHRRCLDNASRWCTRHCTHDDDFYLLVFFCSQIQRSMILQRALCPTNAFEFSIRPSSAESEQSTAVAAKKEEINYSYFGSVLLSPAFFFFLPSSSSSSHFSILNGSAIDIKLSVCVPMSVARTHSNTRAPHTRAQSYLRHAYTGAYVLSCVAIASIHVFIDLHEILCTLEICRAFAFSSHRWPAYVCIKQCGRCCCRHCVSVRSSISMQLPTAAFASQLTLFVRVAEIE